MISLRSKKKTNSLTLPCFTTFREFHIDTEALMPSMMVRYAGPKVFVALQQTEDIHDEGGTGVS